MAKHNQWEVRIKSHKKNVCEEMNKCRVDVVIIVWQSKALKNKNSARDNCCNVRNIIGRHRGPDLVVLVIICEGEVS